MTEERLPLFIGVDTIKADLGVSRAKAYNPRAIVVNGKVNRICYEEACLLTGAH